MSSYIRLHMLIDLGRSAFGFRHMGCEVKCEGLVIPVLSVRLAFRGMVSEIDAGP